MQNGAGRRGDGSSGVMGRSGSGAPARPGCGSRTGSSSAPSMLFQALPPKNPQEVRPTRSRVVLNEAWPCGLGPLLPSIASVPRGSLQEGERWRRPALPPPCLEQPLPGSLQGGHLSPGLQGTPRGTLGELFSTPGLGTGRGPGPAGPAHPETSNKDLSNLTS